MMMCDDDDDVIFKVSALRSGTLLASNHDRERLKIKPEATPPVVSPPAFNKTAMYIYSSEFR